MDYIAEMFQLQEKYTVSASLLNLSNEYHPHKKTLHLFVEDDDDYDFYRSFAVRIYNGYEIQKYSQKGKQNLVDAFNQIEWARYNPGRVLFFYDKDYDDLLGNAQPIASNLFKTSHYSLENYFVIDEVYRIILSKFFYDVPPQMIDDVIRDIKPLYDLFVGKLKIITSWILIYRKKGQDCDLDEIKFEDLFYRNKSNLSCIKMLTTGQYTKLMNDPNVPPQDRKRYRIKSLRSILEESTKADPSFFAFKEFVSNFRQINGISEKKQYLRGKYEFWFIFRVFFPYFKEKSDEFNRKAHAHNSILTNVIKIPGIVQKTLIKEDNIFGIVPQWMKIPADIDLFLRNNHAQA
ncbi:DUF4435 domain-containing protein [Chitinophaga arvensicola]|uniref:DUF4435 domain-containing protein n=1 Tax=Chitinophaga arvensicola TaxID=29529 RepID=A0A1I0S7N0_9BACT|nr:DUF4435 domain-containing protein [Chitinophaga arvensicola]SEW51619.1 Protein of unknown function [Chitinophaga arvensicola]